MLRFFKRHKILAILLIIVLLWGIVFMCEYRRSSWYSEEQHAKRIAKRLEKDENKLNYKDGSSYESFNVYSLYDENNKLEYFLVEYEPYGFDFLEMRDYEIRPLLLKGWGVSMYFKSLQGIIESWSPYTKDLTKSQPEPDRDKKWILDERGNKIEYTKSPYYISGHINDKKYLLRGDDGFILAVKQGDLYINLISGVSFDINSEEDCNEQATMSMQFIPKPAYFDLR
mgnify:FL=1